MTGLERAAIAFGVSSRALAHVGSRECGDQRERGECVGGFLGGMHLASPRVFLCQ